MALVGLAIIGKDNEPLYLRDFTADADAPFSEADMFGISGNDEVEDTTPSSLAPKGFSCSLRQQFILHAALDRFEELTAGNRWRKPGSAGSEAMWVGLLLPTDEHRVYGYLSTTLIKFIAVVEDAYLPDRMQQQTAREAELKSLFANIHMLYVEYMLNPFNDINTKITSQRFDDGVDRFVTVAFNSPGTAVI